MNTDMNILVKKAAQLIIGSDYAIAFTGAGISAESGIPTFRGKGGLWEKYDPSEYATVQALRKNPLKVWKLYVEIFETMRKARPNKAHIALAELEKLGLLKFVITQNIDDLHEKAGTKLIAKIHGTYDVLRCDNCFYREKLDTKSQLLPFEPPFCPNCGEMLRADVVLFGESLPSNEFSKALREAEKADLVLAIGTSGVVVPAAWIPFIVKEKGGKLIEINLEASNLTPIADISIFGKAGDIMDKILKEVKVLLGT